MYILKYGVLIMGLEHFDHSYMLWETGELAAIGMALLVIAGAFLLAVALAVFFYILQSLGLYTIAKRRGIHKPWLAWVPFGNMWILGSISDQYQYVVKGRVRNRRKVLLGLTVAIFVLTIPISSGYLAMMASALFQNMQDGWYAVGVYMIGIILGALALFVTAIVAMVIEYVATYDLFASCEPANALLYLVLSILFTVTLPIFMFICRKKDLGMPPRREVLQQTPAEDSAADAPEE